MTDDAEGSESRVAADAFVTERPLQEQVTNPNLPAFRRYQRLALGTESLLYFLKYELVMLLAGPVPGALGLLLRKVLFPSILGSVGRNVVFGRGITVRHGLKVHLGDDVVIDDGATLDAKGETNSGITVGNDVFISRNSVLSCKNGDITIGDGCAVGINCLVHAMEGSGVVIGNDVLIAAFVYLVGSGPYETAALDVPFKKQGIVPRGGISIGRNVWIGSGAQVFDGVTIGNGVIVGSQTVVNRSVPDYTVVAGVPMRTIRKRENGRQITVATSS